MKSRSKPLLPIIALLGMSATATANAAPEGKADKGAAKAEDKANKAEAKANDAAEKSAAKADKAADKAAAKADKAEAKADKAEAKADKAEEKADKAEAKADKAGERAEEKGERLGERPGEPRGAGHGRFRNGIELLRDDVKAGKVKPAELKDRLAKLSEDRGARKKEHREFVKNRWGALLAQPSVREELRLHARRTAFLSRALLLAQTEPSIKDKDKLIERIEKLTERENDRHEKAMTRLQASPGTPANAVAIQATPDKGAQK